MFKSLTRSILPGTLLLFASLTTFNSYADTMAFSYRFEGNRFPDHPWGPGATLTGQIDGTIDPLNPDRVIINSFEDVVLNRPGLPGFEYDDIDTSEFSANSDPISATPVMSFSGAVLDFRSCPEGFVDDLFPDGAPDGILDDCPYGIAPGGGFLMEHSTASGRSFATAADGTGSEVCLDPDPDPDPLTQIRMDGCRVTDSPVELENNNWSLVVESFAIEIDIKPGSDPNCLNVNGHGVIPVALMGSSSFDVTLVDTSSVLFGGLEVRVRGNKGPLCNFEDSDGDASLDLVCHFEDDSTSWAPGDGDAMIIGALLDGTEFTGTNSICVVP